MSASRTMASASLQNDDPYSALRTHHEEQQLRHQQMVSAIMSTTRQASTSHDHTKQQPNNDPYAALRQLSEPSPSLTILPSSTSTWSPPKPKPQQIYTEPPHHVSLWQEKVESTMNDEWVEAEPYDPEEDEDEDVMTVISSSTTQSTTSSTQSHQVNVFSDLDPLAQYRRNKTSTQAT
ncbi:hypothetical protein BC941DRAFT_100053 [Chlamydoabsidia padenii]|nr:hypothetical protein BC941DRAFT_100053 [Chlamydoabsidia padenii]